ncbi:MAG: mechanosensitive ion channel family protein [Acidobacteriota bacterium]
MNIVSEMLSRIAHGWNGRTQQDADSGALAASVDDMRSAVDLIRDRVEGWVEGTVALLPNLVVALLVLGFFALLARMAQRLSLRFFQRVSDNAAIARLLSTLARMMILAVGLFIALGVLQLDKTVTSLLAGAGVIGIALAFAFQDLAANLIAGVYMSFKRPLGIDELVETNGVFGKVKRIDLRNTILATTTGQIVIMPNRKIFEETLLNYSRSGERRVDVAVGVSYDEDLAQVGEVTRAAVADVEACQAERGIEVYFTAFGGSSIDLIVRFWIEGTAQRDYLAAQSDAIMRIKTAYDAHDISIPFPIRTLDFGIRGGARLDEMALSPAIARDD